MNLDLMRRELACISDIPQHKLGDAEFLRGQLAIGRSGFRDALETVHDLKKQVDELRRAIMGAEPMPDVTHGQFLEMAAELHQHQRGHENSIRAIGKLLRLCDDNGLGDKAREAMKGMEMTDAETIAAVRGALNTEETGENLVEVARAAHAAELRMAYLISDADVEALARAMCEDDGFKWDAKDFGETANGEDPEDQREYWRAKARIAADCFIGGESHETAHKEEEIANGRD